MITGQDLVEWQLRVAAGEPLPASQAEIAINGHAFEARIYAEDPDRDFLPATGHISYLQTPEPSEQVRIDTGVRAGDDISVYYDPMIAKLIVHGEDRRQALQRLTRALTAYRIAGLTTNVDFLYNLAGSAPFAAAELDTGFIERHRHLVFRDDSADRDVELAMASLYTILDQERRASRQAAQDSDPHSPWHSTGGWRLNEPHRLQVNLQYRGEDLSLTITPLTGARSGYTMPGIDREIQLDGRLDGDRLQVDIDGFRQPVTAAEHDGIISIYHGGGAFQFRPLAADTGEEGDAASQGNPRAPMTGRIVKLLVEPAQAVSANAPLLVMEAMKMEHTIRAPADGIVAEFFFQPGELVDGDAELLSFEADEA